MDGKVTNQKGLTLIEIAVVLVILTILGSIFIRNLSRFNASNSIEIDCKRIHAFLQQMRMEAFSKKMSLDITLSNNGTRLCETVQGKCIDLNNRFSTSGDFTITDRGIFSNGNIHLSEATTDNPTYSCVVLSTTRVRLGEWNGSSCIAK